MENQMNDMNGNDQSKINLTPNEVEIIEEDVIKYTPDAAFNELCDQDETTELTGYIDEIHASTVVGAKIKYDLFKFVVNNGSKERIFCLIWGKTLINKYEGEVIHKKIIHLEGAVTKATASTYYKEANKLVPLELLINDTTLVSILL